MCTDVVRFLFIDRVDTVRLLIELGANRIAHNKFGNEPIHVAAFGGKFITDALSRTELMANLLYLKARRT
jgi:ankyrin repeat protein